MKITQINIFRNRGEWCYAAFTDTEFDHGDTCDAATEAEAEAAMSREFPDAVITRVDDTAE